MTYNESPFRSHAAGEKPQRKGIYWGRCKFQALLRFFLRLGERATTIAFCKYE